MSHELFPEAQLKPGRVQGFWASIDGKYLLAGVGEPGSNPIFAWRDENPVAGTQLAGLSCDQKMIVYYDVQLGPPTRSPTNIFDAIA